METKFLEFVADVMEVEVGDISMETEYKKFPQWDSLMMMNLIMEIEEEFDVSISMEMAGNIKKLQDLYELIEK